MPESCQSSRAAGDMWHAECRADTPSRRAANAAVASSDVARRKKIAFGAAGQTATDDSPNLSSLSQGIYTAVATTGRIDAIDLAKYGGDHPRGPMRLRATPAAPRGDGQPTSRPRRHVGSGKRGPRNAKDSRQSSGLERHRTALHGPRADPQDGARFGLGLSSAAIDKRLPIRPLRGSCASIRCLRAPACDSGRETGPCSRRSAAGCAHAPPASPARCPSSPRRRVRP